ncbi:MAG: amidohydrolase family protein, partial [Bryobacteraceae bacterium]
MKCHGIDIASKERLELSFSEVIEAADPLIGRRDNLDYLAPGFIDLQVNGFAGVDYNSPVAPYEEIAHSIQALFATGVTRFFPTVITGNPEEMTGALRNLTRARESLADGKAMEGFHVEGPFISPDDGPRGAHPQRWVRPPDIEEYRRFQDAAEGHVRLITLSPEWPEAPRFIETVTGEG